MKENDLRLHSSLAGMESVLLVSLFYIGPEKDVSNIPSQQEFLHSTLTGPQSHS